MSVSTKRQMGRWTEVEGDIKEKTFRKADPLICALWPHDHCVVGPLSIAKLLSFLHAHLFMHIHSQVI